MKKLVVCFLWLGLMSGAWAQGAKQSLAPNTPVEALKPGEWLWFAETVPDGPMLLMVSIKQQRAYLYRNGVRVAVTTVSTGKQGKETPTGVFSILQKNKDHKSNLYDNSPMPYMQRLTWDGIALHTGKNPGYPASHGCVRLPDAFAQKLFATTELGMTVIVAADEAAHPERLANPKVFAQSMDAKGHVIEAPSLSENESYRWQPEKSRYGPVTILVSAKDHLVMVLRNGIEIGRSKIGVQGDQAFGDQAYVVLEGRSGQASKLVPGQQGLNWMAVGLPGHDAESSVGLDPDAIGRIALPIDFAQLIYPILRPGSSLLLTDQSINAQDTGQGMTVLSDESDPD